MILAVLHTLGFLLKTALALCVLWVLGICLKRLAEDHLV
jgi:hypothetical protein